MLNYGLPVTLYLHCFRNILQRFERRLKQVRRNLEDLAHDLLAAKKREELVKHNFAVGHTTGRVVKGKAEISGESAKTKQEAGREQKSCSEDAMALAAAASAAPADGGNHIETNNVITNTERSTYNEGVVSEAINHPESDNAPLRPGEVAAVVPGVSVTTSDNIAATDNHEDGGVKRNTQAGGETATKTGLAEDRHQEAAEDNSTQQFANTKGRTSPPPLLKLSSAAMPEQVEQKAVNPKQREQRALPDSLAQEIGARAFPLASDGISCAAFHALAAEAVWTGFNDSDHVEKPPESVWDPRGGDRWGTAAFFADCLGQREEEAVPGVPQTKVLQLDQDCGDGSGGGGGHPCSGSSARHAAARLMCLAAVSSRRGFLKQAAETAAKEVLIL